MNDDTYHGRARSEILPLFTTPVDRVLEVGCGRGATLKMLKDKGLAQWLAGLEIDPEAGAVAASHLDAFQCGDVEAVDLPPEMDNLDAILCLDVLEHLRDPWAMVDRLSARLKPGGVMIASLPNLRHYKVSLPLVFRGKFRYDPQGGIMDATHLRFFVRETAIELLSRKPLVVEQVMTTGIKKGKSKWLINKLLGGALTDLYALQFLIRARREGP